MHRFQLNSSTSSSSGGVAGSGIAIRLVLRFLAGDAVTLAETWFIPSKNPLILANWPGTTDT